MCHVGSQQKDELPHIKRQTKPKQKAPNNLSQPLETKHPHPPARLNRGRHKNQKQPAQHPRFEHKPTANQPTTQRQRHQQQPKTKPKARLSLKTTIIKPPLLRSLKTTKLNPSLPRYLKKETPKIKPSLPPESISPNPLIIYLLLLLSRPSPPLLTDPILQPTGQALERSPMNAFPPPSGLLGRPLVLSFSYPASVLSRLVLFYSSFFLACPQKTRRRKQQNRWRNQMHRRT